MSWAELSPQAKELMCNIHCTTLEPALTAAQPTQSVPYEWATLLTANTSEISLRNV